MYTSDQALGAYLRPPKLTGIPQVVDGSSKYEVGMSEESSSTHFN